MKTTGSSERALQSLCAAIPDLGRRLESFTVLSGPADAELRSFFLEHMTAALAKLRAALQRSDWPLIAREAHSLKGAGGGVGYPEISVWSESLEQAAKARLAAETQALIEVLGVWLSLEQEGAS